MSRWARDNGLALFFGAIFLAALAGQALVGHSDFNNQQLAHHDRRSPSAVRHLVEFAVDVAENWQSEYLQFLLYIVATVWLVQRGSPESKQPATRAARTTRSRSWAGTRARTRRRGQRPAAGGPPSTPTPSAVMGTFFLLLGRAAVAGRVAYNGERLDQLAPLSAVSYLGLGLLEPHAAELAVGVPRGRQDGRLHHLPAPARVARVETRGVAARRDRGREQLARRLR